VTALLDFTLYSFPFPTHLGPLDLYLDSHCSIANTHGSPLHYRNMADGKMEKKREEDELSVDTKEG
jgi:hypothetical protein